MSKECGYFDPICLRFDLLHTMLRKNLNQPYNIRLYIANFWQPNVHVQQNIFGKILLEVGSWHLYASFGTFCVQIGQFFEAQWVFENCLKTVKSLFSKENDGDFEFFRIESRLIDQFGLKRCQKKHKDVS